ncbi:c-type cytochrome [Wenyingzhuangia sp. 2_MG-2023]|uniref:c-type cytochrome n=1 Tax=Wenyingzhuangia sp. 2_MG-2023 TaxID=3062639 RepID=UPI0026E4874C|nr:c-type cytochrome [Wenyingzhuangia sp. 2_MG-2023]MDO6738059.1 c-type cytochrome [Wenyingzhuangia sp. 2_MG-2023]MDO6802587.1 c-type cytochrome [Wenyingzhuangia sp. 1_MG-2023]
MKIVKLHRKLSSVLKLSLALFFSFSLSLSAQEPSEEQAKAGKALFNMHCASCHKLNKKSTGPALYKVAERREMDWLKAWIKNNNKLRASGDADAKAIYEEYGGVAMSVFEFLSDKQIEDILAYTTVGDAKKATGNVAAAHAVEVESTPSEILPKIATIVVVLVLLSLIGWVFLKSNNGFLKIFAVIILVFLGVYFGFTALMSIGVDEGYQPVQPIAFSHKIHAGDNKIDCQYCHSSAKHSKTSGIPSVNVCMNCHKNISEVADDTKIDIKGKEYLDKEIQKVYEAAGWDAENLKYTGETKPIKWVRIHNLPDFAYFNHSQHVTVAGVKCQKCHGPVEEMDEMYQFSPLTMGWCIDCHKETEVNIEGNGYYKKIHEQLSHKYGVEKVTIAQLGGKECGKCHY